MLHYVHQVVSNIECLLFGAGQEVYNRAKDILIDIWLFDAHLLGETLKTR